MTGNDLTVLYLGGNEGFEAARETIGERARLVHLPAEPAAVANALKGAVALLDASMKVSITDAMIADAPRLRIISCATTGSDHIDRGEASRLGVAIHTLREDSDLLRTLTPAAELTFALLLACARKLPAALRDVKEGNWVRERFPGLMLNGRRLGIVGCGRIGGWVGRYGQAFGMEVVGYDPYVAEMPPHIRPIDLQRLCETSDVISVHVHLTDDTRGLISAFHFAQMKPGAIFLNTSRGAVADESALLHALETGRLAAAGLDVLDGEPDVKDHPLRRYAETHDNLLITPHCGGYSPDAVRIVCRRAAEKILPVLKKSYERT
jgi:D-3-phosphoglycerate dehydrogenase